MEELAYEIRKYKNRKVLKRILKKQLKEEINKEDIWMNKIDWGAKLSSRKFWALLAALVVGVLAIFAVPDNIITQVSGIITALGAIIAYILTEGKIDAASATAYGMIQAAKETQPPVTNNYAAPIIPDGYVQVGDTIIPESSARQVINEEVVEDE